MSERPYKPDIDYSIMREEPRATFSFPERFDKPSYNYEDVFINELLIEHQPYELNENSPTPLDPWHLRMHMADYVTSASVYMENRLMVAANKIGLGDDHREAILNEISHEHILRSNRNNETMRHFRSHVDATQSVDPVMAELVLKARAGAINIEEAAYLLAAFSDIEEDIGIEVVKYTGPLIDLVTDPVRVEELGGRTVTIATKFDAVDYEYAKNLERISQDGSGIIVDSSSRQPQRPRNSDGFGIKNVLVTKAKEDDLYITPNGGKMVHIESVGRYSYYVPGVTDEAFRKVKPTMAKINNKPMAMYPIAVSKYVRFARSR